MHVSFPCLTVSGVIGTCSKSTTDTSAAGVPPVCCVSAVFDSLPSIIIGELRVPFHGVQSALVMSFTGLPKQCFPFSMAKHMSVSCGGLCGGASAPSHGPPPCPFPGFLLDESSDCIPIVRQLGLHLSLPLLGYLHVVRQHRSHAAVLCQGQHFLWVGSHPFHLTEKLGS